jgi:hypothetical protein
VCAQLLREGLIFEGATGEIVREVRFRNFKYRALP